MSKKYPQYIIDKAIELRLTKKLTVPKIAEMMGVAKSTVDKWMKEYPLEERTKKQTRAQKRAADANRDRAAAKRQDAYNEGLEQAPVLFTDNLFRDFVNLYLCEGTRKRVNHVEFSNSNPKMIKLAYFWIKQFTQNAIRFRVQVHIDQDEDEIKNFWASLLEIKVESVTVMRKSNSGKLSGRNFRSKYGVLSVETADTYFRARLQAWMDYLEKDWLDNLNKK